MKRADFWIGVVIAVLVLVIARASGHALDPIIDTGRDLYIPEQIRGGIKLYRDILYYYPPLAPYLLALITSLTGSSLAAYTGIGAAIALLTTLAVYSIVRIVASPIAANTSALLFVACSVYSISGRTSNYLFPYAHAATLAMLFFLAGSAFVLAWAFVDRRARWLGPGLFLLLAAAWTKLEYVVFAAVVVAIAALAHRMSIRWVAAWIATGIASLIAVDRYFADAPAGHHWLFDNVLASSLLHGESARYFYRQVAGFDLFGANLWAAILSAVILIAIIAAIRTTDRFTSRGVMILVAMLIAAIALVSGNNFFRGWAIVQLALVPFALKHPREPMLFLLALSLCGSSRVFLRMTPEWYGFVFLIPAYALIGYLLFDWFPSRGVYSVRASRLAVVPLIAISAHFLWTANRVMAQKVYPVRTGRGLFYDANLGRAAALDAFLRSFHGHSLVVVPEGLTLNYLTHVKTPMSFHTFTPVETADPQIEDEIIQDLAAHPPEFIAVVTRPVTDFGYRGFGVDYDRKLAAVIRERYALAQRWRFPSFELILLRAAPHPAFGHLLPAARGEGAAR